MTNERLAIALVRLETRIDRVMGRAQEELQQNAAVTAPGLRERLNAATLRATLDRVTTEVASASTALEEADRA